MIPFKNTNNNGFVLTSFGKEVDNRINRLAAQAKSRYWHFSFLLPVINL